MPFTMPDFRKLSMEEVAPWHNALQTAMSNLIKMNAVKYAEPTSQAEIFAKTMGPLSNIAISPLMMAMNPEQRAQITDYISQMLKNNQLPGAQQQAPENHGILSKISGLFGQGQAPSQEAPGNAISHQVAQALQVRQQGGASNDVGLLPGANQDISVGAKAQVEAPYRTSPVAPGALYQSEPGKPVISAPTGQQVALQQNTIKGLEKVMPIINDLILESQDYLGPGGASKLAASQLSGGARKLGFETIANMLGGEAAANKYANVLALRAKAISALKEANMTEKEARDIIEPHPGQNAQGYSANLMRRLVEFAKTRKASKKTIGSGFQISDEDNYKVDQQAAGKSGTSVLMRAPDGTEDFVPINQLEKARKLGLVDVKGPQP